MKKEFNSQEKFWNGEFGKNYIKRNISKELKINTDVFFRKIFKKKNKIKLKNLIELGSSVGNNLESLSKIYKNIDMTAVEINSQACKILRKKNLKVNVINSSIATLNIKLKYDLVLIKGVLIHVNPKQLNKVYEKIFKLSKKYILIAEYYSPKPEKVTYRKKRDKLFKRDFAGEMIKKYNLKLLDYGFAYHLDKNPQDDLNWFLLEK
jgi:spore coat polysaccharide biosynthesis protein SpsF